MKATRISAVLAAAALLPLAAGCGGGGASTAAAPAVATTAGPRTPARGVATIVIPARTASASGRGPQWISPSTKSLQINAKRLSDGWTEVTVQALTPTTNGCTAQSNGSTVCQVPFTAPPTDGTANDDLTVNLFDLVDPYFANILGFAEIMQPVSSMQSNVFNFTVAGVVDGLNANPVSNSVTAATATNLTFAVTFYDARVNTIPGAFDSPVVLTMAGPQASHFSITAPSTATLAQAGSVTVRYDGAGTKGSFAAINFTTNSPSTFANRGGTPPPQIGFITINII